MSILFAPRYRWLVSVSGALLIALAVGLWLTNGASVYGQGAPNAMIPNLQGQWQGEIAGYAFEDVRSPGFPQPQYVQSSTDEDIISIEFQNGRAFAGYGHPSSPHPSKLAGVISPDGTISIQAAAESGGGLRTFATCKLAIERGKYVMTGTMVGFDDLFPESDALMGTVTVRYVKLN